MGTFNRFEEIEAWKQARILTKEIYQATSANTFDRDLRLRDQLRSASVSIMSNIAEGFERDGNREFLQFLSVAKSSCGELRAQMYICLDTGFFSEDVHKRLHEQATSVSRLLFGLMRYLRNSDRRGLKYE